MDYRGIILSPPIKVDSMNNKVIIESNEINPIELRASLLYWDKIRVPVSNIIEFEFGPDVDFLEREGYLDKFKIKHHGGEVGKAMAESYVDALMISERMEPGVWSLSRGEKSLLMDCLPGGFIDNSGVIMSLYQSLPVPGSDVPLDEILEFKQKSLSELLGFRCHMDELIQEISSSQSKDSIDTVLKRLEESCNDLEKSGSLWRKYKTIPSNMEVSINLNPGSIIASTLGLWTGLSSLGIDDKLILGGSSILATMSSVITIKKGFKFTARSPDSNAFQYIVKARRRFK